LTDDRIKLADIPDVADLTGLKDDRPTPEPEPEPDPWIAAELERHEPVFVDAWEFVEQHVEAPPPLWGDEETTVIPAGGICLLAGRPGSGKTTLVLDLACHLAAGESWPPAKNGNEHAPVPFAAPKPLRIALVENEGPQEMFRDKLATKLRAFPHHIGRVDDSSGGCLSIQAWRWGAFSFADRDAHAVAIRELDEQQIDLVIGDPLATLGPEGVGSPAETRAFVQLLRPLGLGRSRAFLFLHHFRERVERTEDELSRISGAWGGHLDTLITLSAMGNVDQARLAWPKLRWGRRRAPKPVVLGRDYDAMAFLAIAEEGDASFLEPKIVDALEDLRRAGKGAAKLGWSTSTELSHVIEAGRSNTESALKGAPTLFAMRTGEDAVSLGRKKQAKLWGLVGWLSTDPVHEQLATAETVEADMPDW
jgi:hypothetical protein